MDARTVASSDGTEEYRFLPNGGTSWNAPYIAGMYGLACQVSPDITPEKFFEILIRTGEFVDIEKNGEVHKMGRVVNPVGIINELQKVNED